MPPTCERQSTLPVETATLTVTLPSFSGNVRNICIFLKRKAAEGKIIHNADKNGEKPGTQVKNGFEREPGEKQPCSQENQIYVRRWPATVLLAWQYNAMPGFFFVLLVLARTGFEPKSEMLGDADGGAGCVIVDQRPLSITTAVLVSRTQNTRDRHQMLSSKKPCHACI